MYSMQEKDLLKRQDTVEHIPQNGADMQPALERPKTEKEHVQTDEPQQDKEQAVQGIRSILTRKSQNKVPVAPIRDTISVEVEKIMEEGLRDAFVKLPPADREMFKIKGEQTAYQIRDLLRATHVKVKKVFALLMDWLKLLPGVNRFFLEQEAKIKADKIIALKNRH